MFLRHFSNRLHLVPELASVWHSELQNFILKGMNLQQRFLHPNTNFSPKQISLWETRTSIVIIEVSVLVFGGRRRLNNSPPPLIYRHWNMAAKILEEEVWNLPLLAADFSILSTPDHREILRHRPWFGMKKNNENDHFSTTKSGFHFKPFWSRIKQLCEVWTVDI